MQRAPMRTPSSSVTLRADARSLADRNVRAEHRAGADDGVVADRAVAADDGVRVDLRARGYARARRDDGARVHAGHDGAGRVQRRGDARVGEVGLGMHEARDGTRGAIARRDDDGALRACCASCARYKELARNVTASGAALDSVPTRLTTTLGSP